MNGLFGDKYYITLNFFGKTAGSTTNNRNIAKLNNVELSQSDYNIVANEDSSTVTGEIECFFDLSVILSSIYNDNIDNLRDALKSISDSGLIWNNNTSSYETYNTNNLSNYVSDTGIIQVKYTNPDFPQIICTFSKQPDTYDFNRVPTQRLEQNFNIYIRNLCFAYKKSIKNNVIFTYYKDANNYYILQKTIDDRIEFKKVVDGVVNILASDTITFQSFQTFNIYIAININRTRMTILHNFNGNLYDYSSIDGTHIRGICKFLPLSHIAIGYECDGFYDLIRSNNKDYSDDEVLDILYGKSSLMPTPNLFNKNNVLVDQISDVGMLSIDVLPNNYFTLDVETNGGTLAVKQYYNTINLSADTLISNNSTITILSHSLCNRVTFTMNDYSKFGKIEFKYHSVKAEDNNTDIVDGGMFIDSNTGNIYDGGIFVDSNTENIYNGDIWEGNTSQVADGGLFGETSSSSVYDGGSYNDTVIETTIDGETF